MASRIFAIGSLVLLTAMAASSTTSTSAFNGLKRTATPGTARLYAIGTRSAQQSQSATDSKLDSVLADLSRHAGLARPGHVLEDLHSLSPAARFTQSPAPGTPLVLVDAVTRGSPQQLKSALVALGLQRPAVYSNDVGGWLPVDQIETAAARAEVDSIRAALPRKRASVATQGDYAQASSVLRTDYPTLTGTGITVGIISDSFNCYAVYAEPGSGVPVSGYEGYAFNGFTADYATDVSTSALPSGVNVLEEANCLDYGAPTQPPLTDEGRAMLQVVHAVAPGASLAFYTGFESEADFASGIGALATAGAKIIGDDLGYFDEPFFEDGIVAQAIDAVEAQGVAYFSAAGNDGYTPSYQNTAPAFPTLQSSGNNANQYLLNFDTTGATTTTALPITVPPIPPGDFLAVVVEWDQPYLTGCTATATSSCTGATSQIDVCITGGTGSDTITNYDGTATTCTGLNAIGTDPYQIMVIGNPANAKGNTQQQNLNIVVGLANGSTKPGRIIVSVEDDGLGSTINQFVNSSGPTIQGHPAAAGAAAVGAAFYFDTPRCGTTPAQLEAFSSQGGAPILFNGATGVRLATPVVRQKPDFVGPDGVNTTFLGFTLASDSPPFPSTGLLSTTITACQNNPSYPNFFGTSAATPHAASIGALMLQANSGATPTEIYQALRASALPMASVSPNQQSGFGFIQATTALAVPAMSLAAPTVALRGSTTLTWSTINATSCTASGAWSGALAANGTQTVTLTTSGPSTYTLTCVNAAGVSASNSVTLTDVVPAEPTLTISAPSINLGDSATIAWVSPTAASCTASGSWSGLLPTSGSQVVTPSAGGTDTYSITCANAIGPSPVNSVTLTVNAPPAAPTLTLAATSVEVGSSTTITWSSINATSCTASGNWSGTLASSGSRTITPSAAGTETFSLSCSNSVGSSTASSATLTVTAAPSSGGGGALDGIALWGLAGLSAAQWLRTRRRHITLLLSPFRANSLRRKSFRFLVLRSKLKL